MPFLNKTPTARLPSSIIFVTSALVIIVRFERLLAGLRNAFAALTLNRLCVVRWTYETPSCFAPL